MKSSVIAAIVATAGPLSPDLLAIQAPQTPVGPPQSAHGCLRPDVAKNAQLLKNEVAKGAAAKDIVEVQKAVAGCTYYQVTLVTKITVEDTEVAGVTSTISGKGSITFGLAPDDAMAGYDFTSGVQDLTAPIYWERGSALITKPDCIVTTVELPYTLFSFWLGVTSSPTLKVWVRISPEMDLHSIATRCKDPFGKWHTLPPSQEAIFAPAWIKLHGEGKSSVAPGADQQAITKFTDDVVKTGPKPGGKVQPNKAYTTPPLPTVSSPTGALDLGKLQAMQDYMAKNPNATPAEMMTQMAGVVPNLDQQLAAAEDNFMFTAPGECAAVNPTKTVCALPSTPVTVDRLGYGTIKTITERTTITIEKVAPPP